MVGIIWQLVYARNEGLLNNLLGTAGTPGAVDWFGDSNVNLWAALVATTWRHAGYIMVLYLAGLKSPFLLVADADDYKVLKRVGPFSNVIRPFTVNGSGTLCFVNVDGLLGFEVGDLRTGRKIIKEYGKFERSWDSGMPPATRWMLPPGLWIWTMTRRSTR